MLDLLETWARDTLLPIELRIQCSAIAVKYRHPALAASAISVADERLAKIAAMSPEERVAHARGIIERGNCCPRR